MKANKIFYLVSLTFSVLLHAQDVTTVASGVISSGDNSGYVRLWRMGDGSLVYKDLNNHLIRVMRPSGEITTSIVPSPLKRGGVTFVARTKFLYETSGIRNENYVVGLMEVPLPNGYPVKEVDIKIPNRSTSGPLYMAASRGEGYWLSSPINSSGGWPKSYSMFSNLMSDVNAIVLDGDEIKHFSYSTDKEWIFKKSWKSLGVDGFKFCASVGDNIALFNARYVLILRPRGSGTTDSEVYYYSEDAIGASGNAKMFIVEDTQGKEVLISGASFAVSVPPGFRVLSDDILDKVKRLTSNVAGQKLFK